MAFVSSHAARAGCSFVVHGCSDASLTVQSVTASFPLHSGIKSREAGGLSGMPTAVQTKRRSDGERYIGQVIRRRSTAALSSGGGAGPARASRAAA